MQAFPEQNFEKRQWTPAALHGARGPDVSCGQILWGVLG